MADTSDLFQLGADCSGCPNCPCPLPCVKIWEANCDYQLPDGSFYCDHGCDPTSATGIEQAINNFISGPDWDTIPCGYRMTHDVSPMADCTIVDDGLQTFPLSIFSFGGNPAINADCKWELDGGGYADQPCGERPDYSIPPFWRFQAFATRIYGPFSGVFCLDPGGATGPLLAGQYIEYRYYGPYYAPPTPGGVWGNSSADNPTIVCTC